MAKAAEKAKAAERKPSTKATKATKAAPRTRKAKAKAKGNGEDTASAVVFADGVHSLDMLRPDPENPREITNEALDGLGVSLEEFGDLSGIVFNLRTGELVAGHQRVRQLREAGAAEFVRLPGPGPGTDVARGYVDHPKSKERFDVRFVDWPRSKQRQANVVANSRAIAGHFTDSVDSILSAFQFEAPELFASLHMGDMLAFEPGDVPALPGDEGAGGGGEPEVPEEVPAVAEGEPDSHVGTVYGLGWAVQCACCSEWHDLTEEEAAALFREHGIDPTTLGPDGKPMAVAP